MPLADRPHCVYRAFDGDGALLYVGCTQDPMYRLRHWTTELSEWTFHVRAVSFEWFTTRSAARSVEAAAIRSERPAYNVAHKGPGALLNRSARCRVDREHRRKAAA